MTRPDPSSGPATPEPEEARGLEDPREIHPSPEGIFNDPGGSPAGTPDPRPDSPSSGGEVEVDDGRGGIVDPRRETIGPDL